MKKIILTTLISFGLAIAVNAQKKGHRNHDSHNNHNNDRHERYDRNDRYNDRYRSHHRSSHHNTNYNYYGGSSYHYVTKKVWVPGCSKRVWVPPRYRYERRRCGTVVRVCVSQGYYDYVRTPGYYTYQRVRVSSPYRRCNNSGLSISWRF